MPENYDAIVIGAGQAGPPLAERLGQAGLRTAIIERHLLGGTCVNVGCIPTKTLVGSARVAYLARRAGEFGVVVERPVGMDPGDGAHHVLRAVHRPATRPGGHDRARGMCRVPAHRRLRITAENFASRTMSASGNRGLLLV